MSNFVQSSADGLTIVLNDSGQRVPLYSNMKVGFDDVGGAQVWLERHKGEVVCEASLPESTEPLTWRFDISEYPVRNTHSSLPLKGASNLLSLIADCRVGLNGRL